MKFLIKVIIAWFKKNEIPVVIYGADGSPIANWEIKPKDYYFPPKRLDKGDRDRDGLYCYPLNANGEYCGCICWKWVEDDDDFEQPEIYDILNICNLLEVGCGEDENS